MPICHIPTAYDRLSGFGVLSAVAYACHMPGIWLTPGGICLNPGGSYAWHMPQPRWHMPEPRWHGICTSYAWHMPQPRWHAQNLEGHTCHMPGICLTYATAGSRAQNLEGHTCHMPVICQSYVIWHMPKPCIIWITFPICVVTTPVLGIVGRVHLHTSCPHGMRWADIAREQIHKSYFWHKSWRFGSLILWQTPSIFYRFIIPPTYVFMYS